MKKFKKREKKTKKCPRCGTVCAATQNVCEECGLIFSRLEIATNAEAKRHILKRDRDFIVYTSDLPKDVKRWKLILFTLLFGLVGGQYYYVGKFWKGAVMSLMFVWLILSTIFNDAIVAANVTTYVYFPIGIYTVAWLMSIVFVISNRFKVPVMVEQPKLDDVEKIREDFNKVGDEIREEIQKNAQQSDVQSGENGEEKAAGVTFENVDEAAKNADEVGVQPADVSSRKTGKISKNGINKKGKKKK